MATKALIDKIEALPPEKRAEVEDFVEFLAGRQACDDATPRRPRFPEGLLDQIKADRDALLEEYGPIETQQILRDLREDGGR